MTTGLVWSRHYVGLGVLPELLRDISEQNVGSPVEQLPIAYLRPSPKPATSSEPTVEVSHSRRQHIVYLNTLGIPDEKLGKLSDLLIAKLYTMCNLLDNPAATINVEHDPDVEEEKDLDENILKKKLVAKVALELNLNRAVFYEFSLAQLQEIAQRFQLS